MKKFRNFAISTDFRLSGSQLGFRFFGKLKIFLDSSFLIWKWNEIVNSLQKKIMEIVPTVLKISYFEGKMSFEFYDVWVRKAYFWPPGKRIDSNFCFYVIAHWWETKILIHHKEYLQWFSEKSNFFTPFCTVAAFTKSAKIRRRAVREKHLCVFQLQNKKLYRLNCFFFFFRFLRSKLDSRFKWKK